MNNPKTEMVFLFKSIEDAEKVFKKRSFSAPDFYAIDIEKMQKDDFPMFLSESRTFAVCTTNVPPEYITYLPKLSTDK